MNAHVSVLLRALTTTALNFVRTNTPESCTRLCAVMFCSAGCLVGLVATDFAFAHPPETGGIVALTGPGAGCRHSLVARLNHAIRVGRTTSALVPSENNNGMR